jgi:hypothetical protein
MKKWQVLEYCDEKSLEGYITHKMILEIYNDTEDIPDEVVDFICHKPEPPKELIIVMGSNLAEQIDIAAIHYCLTSSFDKN